MPEITAGSMPRPFQHPAPAALIPVWVIERPDTISACRAQRSTDRQKSFFDYREAPLIPESSGCPITENAYDALRSSARRSKYDRSRVLHGRAAGHDQGRNRGASRASGQQAMMLSSEFLALQHGLMSLIREESLKAMGGEISDIALRGLSIDLSDMSLRAKN